MAFCKTLTNGRWNFVGGCNRSISNAFLHLRCRASASTALSVLYDLPMVLSIDDPAVVKINTFNVISTEYGQLGNYLVEFFTWMKYIPSSVASWKRLAEERHKEYSNVFVGMFREVENRIVIIIICCSFPASLTNHVETRGRTPELCWDIYSGTGAPSPERDRSCVDSCYNVVCIILYLRTLRIMSMLTFISAAGAETVRSGLLSTIIYFFHTVQSAAVMSWFMLGMTAYPEVQRKCQEELDKVIGRSRMPTLADRDHLPYICATLREALRWRPVGPLGESLAKINLITDPHQCLVT